MRPRNRRGLSVGACAFEIVAFPRLAKLVAETEVLFRIMVVEDVYLSSCLAFNGSLAL